MFGKSNKVAPRNDQTTDRIETILGVSSSFSGHLKTEGGVRIDGAVISDKQCQVQAGTVVLQVGKRKFAKVTLTA